MVDLHCHSNYSDGTYTPQELLRQAEKTGLTVLALTDHDTVDGLKEFLATITPVHKVAGVEISIDYDAGIFHMVGLFIDPFNSDLLDTLEVLKNYRRLRNKFIIDKLSGLVGRKVEMEEIATDNYGELGRPHIARFMIKMGIVRTIEEAFELYLGKGRPLYADKKRLSVDDAIDLIHRAGGLAILAHPITLSESDRFDFNFFKKLKSKGLDGLEAYCSLHSYEQAAMYLKFAKELDFGVSMGSDFHGENKTDVFLGKHGCTDSEKYYNDLLTRLGRNV